MKKGGSMEFAATTDETLTPWTWKNKPGYKPIFLLIAVAVLLAVVILPPPKSMIDLVSAKNPVGYKLPKGSETIADAVNQKLRPQAANQDKQGASNTAEKSAPPPLGHAEVAKKAMIMVVMLFVAAFLWGTEALPLGATDILIGVLLYLFSILPFEEISSAYMKDAVFFIFGILAVAVGVSKTGLDKRIGQILLSRIRSAKGFAFIFMPLVAIASGFLSAHALVALLVPVLMGVYKVSCNMYGVKKDRALAIFMLLGVCFASNQGGPGSPAAGGRNAIMIGYLMEYGRAMSFVDWMKYGLPYVPLVSILIGAYMYILFKPKFRVKDINPSEVLEAEIARMPKFGGREAVMAVILTLLIIGWIVLGEEAGLGGPTLYAVMAMFLFRIISWDDIQNGVAFDVVGLYAAACAMGAGLKFTGGSLWLANTFVDLLPDFMSRGDGLVIGVSILTGTMTNFMSDGATVAALGPIVLPMATLANVNVWKVGLSCAFSSSFANFLVVGTPNNAIVFGMGRDPETGERLLDVMDFVKFGLPVLIMAWLVLWFWTIWGYWRFMSW